MFRSASLALRALAGEATVAGNCKVDQSGPANCFAKLDASSKDVGILYNTGCRRLYCTRRVQFI